MPTVRLVRPDGSTLDVDAAQAGKFEVLGYKPQSQEQYIAEESAKGQENYWSTGRQKVYTALEGITSGLTLGASDLLLDAAGAEDFKTRGQYNPGTRMASEIVGGLLPLVPGLSALKAVTPAGALIRGGEAVGAGLAARGAGKAAQLGAAGVIEGAGFGAGSALADATISGDPLTVEAISAGIGFGALFGGGLGALGGAVLGRAEARAAKEAAKEAAAEAGEAAIQDAWKGFRGAVADLSEQTSKAIDETSDLKGMLSAKLAEARAVNKVVKDLPVPVEPNAFRVSGQLAKQAAKAFDEVQLAAKEGNAVRMEAAIGKFKQSAEELAGLSHTVLPELSPFSLEAVKSGITAVKDVASLNAASKYLKTFPTSLEELGRTTPAKADKLIGAVDSVMRVNRAEFTGLQEGIKQGVEAMAQRMGVVIDGPVSTQLRGVYEAAKAATKEAVPEVIGSGKLPWMLSAAKQGAAYSAGSMVSRAAHKQGLGTIGRSIGYEGGKRLVQALISMKAAVVGSVAKTAMEWTPKAAKMAKPMGSRMGALAIRLDGSEDKGTRDAKTLMANRAKEIRDSAGSIRDILYKNIQGLAETNPELAAALHAHEVKKFSFILDKLPRDPGLAINRMDSMWKPSPLEMEKFSRYYEVFQNPHAVMTAMLKGSRVLPEWAEGLKEMYPALWTDLRFNMLNRLGDPAIRSKLSYSEQVNLGMLLDLPIHSSMMPQFIVTQQQMFMDRNEQLAIPPRPGISDGGGRPPGPANDPRASAAQKVTSH